MQSSQLVHCAYLNAFPVGNRVSNHECVQISQSRFLFRFSLTTSAERVSARMRGLKCSCTTGTLAAREK
jgi:hypothetical protein